MKSTLTRHTSHCVTDYKPSIQNSSRPFCVQVGLCVCVCVTGVNECVFVSGRRQGQAVGDRAQLAQLLMASK